VCRPTNPPGGIRLLEVEMKSLLAQLGEPRQAAARNASRSARVQASHNADFAVICPLRDWGETQRSRQNRVA
jgi:hypothetical protein